MQREAFPGMPHFISPDEVSSLLRTTQRSTPFSIHVMSLAVIADKRQGFAEFKRSLPKNATVVSQEGCTINRATPMTKAVELWSTARKNGVAKVGGRISADNRKKKSAEGAARIKDRWGLPSKTWSTRILLKEADISYNTAKTLLPPRPVAQYNHKAKHGRQINAIEHGKPLREKPDFCGVYVFQIEKGVYKIGSSSDAGERFKTVSQYHKKQMKVVELFNMERDKAYAVEYEVHYRLRKYRCREYNGREIFRVSLETIKRTVNRAIKNITEGPK